MQVRFLIIIGFISALAVGILGIIWRPYVDAGTSTPAVNHFFSLSITLLAIMLPFFDAARRAAAPNKKSAYSAIISSYFLVWNAAITLLLLISTYMGFGYPLFWSMQAIQLVLFVAILAFGNLIGQHLSERETDANLLRRRKESAIRDLEDLRQRHQPIASPKHATILAAVDSLLEELRFLPNHGVLADAGGIFGRTAKWRIAVDCFLLSNDGQSDHEQHDHFPQHLQTEASSIKRALSSWKC